MMIPSLHPLTLACIALLILLTLGLGLAVSGARFTTQRLSGYEDDPTSGLYHRVRAHGNATEYVPLLVLLFVLTGQTGAGPLVLGLIVTATVARGLHAAGLLAYADMRKPNPLRFLGALGTYIGGVGLAVVLLWRALA
jgi:uncharacterized protein